MAPRVLLIWNPVSTGVDADSIGAASVAAAPHVDLVTRHTREAGDAGRFASEAATDGCDAVFVLGGDGTANEVLNGIGDRLPIGVIPAGGTSVLPRALGLPSDVAECVERLCRALLGNSIRKANIGTLNGRKFAFAAGIGIDAEIVRRVDARGRGGKGITAKRPGDVWFLKEMIELVISAEYSEPRMRVYGDGHEGGFDAMTVFVANTDPWSFAGPLPVRIAPDAAFEGGLEVVAVVEPIEARSSAIRIGALLRRTGRRGGIRRLSVEHARVECLRPTPTQVDGELIGELTEIELGLEKEGARFLV